MPAKKIPTRTCVGCKENKPKKELIRFVRTPEGDIMLDPGGKANGRGAYICSDTSCFELAEKKKGLGRALEINVEPKKIKELEEALAEYLRVKG